nr:IS3 family transposase [uncultured Caproiciproducens sp.]
MGVLSIFSLILLDLNRNELTKDSLKLSLTKQYSILPSMSRAGTPLDNACAENFFEIIKTGCVYRQKIQTIEQAGKFIDDHVCFYNNERIQHKTKLASYQKRCQPAYFYEILRCAFLLPVYFSWSGSQFMTEPFFVVF